MRIIASILCVTPSGRDQHGMGWREYHEVELPDGMPITFENVRDNLQESKIDHNVLLDTSWALENIYVRHPEDLPNDS